MGTIKTGKEAFEYFKEASGCKELKVVNLKGQEIKGYDSYKDLEVKKIKLENNCETMVVIINTNKEFY